MKNNRKIKNKFKNNLNFIRIKNQKRIIHIYENIFKLYYFHFLFKFLNI
jgi:hypothetical protein